MKNNDLDDSEQDASRFPLLANALLNRSTMTNADLNEMYMRWDPYAYQQWALIQSQQQLSYMNGLLASAFTRSRPLNYECTQGKVYQWETLLPIIPKPLFSMPTANSADTIDLTSDEEAELHAHALEQMNTRRSSVIIAYNTQSPAEPMECASPGQSSADEKPPATAPTPPVTSRTTPAAQSTAQPSDGPATELKRVDKQLARVAFRIFIRQNYRFIKRMLGNQYSKENLQYSYSKWWKRMIPAGRGFYQVMAKRSENLEMVAAAAVPAVRQAAAAAAALVEVKVEAPDTQS